MCALRSGPKPTLCRRHPSPRLMGRKDSQSFNSLHTAISPIIVDMSNILHMLLCRNHLAIVKDATMDVSSLDSKAAALHPIHRYLGYSDREPQELRWRYERAWKHIMWRMSLWNSTGEHKFWRECSNRQLWTLRINFVGFDSNKIAQK